MDPLNRAQLKALTAQKFIDNVLQAITPEDARDVIYAVIDSTGLIVEEMAKKADLVNGKVPTSQLPITGMGGIPAWSSLVIYSVGNQVSYESRIWQSKINNNTNIPPAEGAMWTEISATHLQNTDTMLRLPDGTALTAQYILDNLGGTSDAIYKAQIKILAATASYVFDPVAMVPAEYGLAEFAITRESGVECTIEVPGYDPVAIGANTQKVFNIRVLRFSVDDAYVYYCYSTLASQQGSGIPALNGNSLKYLRVKTDETGLEFSTVAGVGVTDGDKTDIVVSGTGTTWLVKASRILGQALTGLGSLTGDLSATDTIVQAFSKIYYFMTNIAATVRGTVMTGLNTSEAGFPSASDSLLVILGKLTRLVNAVPPSPTSATWTGTSVDFGVGYQTRAFSNTQVTINGFSNTSLGKKVRIEITSANAADSLVFAVAGWTRQDIGFPFVPLVTNIVEIHIVGASTYETFITPLTA